MARGEAFGAADARHAWAAAIREASVAGAAGDQARADLLAVLEALPAPREANDKHARDLVQDLVDQARAVVEADAAVASWRKAPGKRTVAALVEAYFHTLDNARGPNAETGTPPDLDWRKPATVAAYKAQRPRILAQFGKRPAAEITVGDVRTWYGDLAGALSLPTANLAVATLGAMMTWAVRNDWRAHSPVQKIGLLTPEGRRVFWTPDEETAFVAWCDANGYADVADGIVGCLWTGARIGDLCRADLAQLAGASWRYKPVKTERKGLEALPGLAAPLKARVERRKAQRLADLGGAFLINPENGRRHTTDSFYLRFVEAQAKAVADQAVPAGFEGKKTQDTRDTCITRLWDAEVSLGRISSWTGHSLKSIEKIIRNHYVSLLESGALETVKKLETWAEQNGLALA
jgi:integrase